MKLPQTVAQPNRRAHRLRRALLVVLLLVLLVAIAIAIAVPVLVDLRSGARDTAGPAAVEGQVPELAPRDRHVLLLMIDGLAVEPFERALAGGSMPHLAHLLAGRPTRSLVALSSFPSSTSPSVPELLSGRYVDMADLPVPPAVHAFDREARTIVRYVTRPDEWQWPVPTLFDALRGRPAVTVFEGRWDGPVAILTQFNMIGQALLEKIGAAALSGGDRGPVEAYFELLRAGEPPVVSLVVLNEFDMTAHFHGPESAQALRALERTDDLIGEIVATLGAMPASRAAEPAPDGEARSLLDRTAIVLFGDHGMAPSGEYVDLPDFFSRRGLSAVDVSTVAHVLFRERLGTLWTRWADAILVSGGSNITQIYLRDPVLGWDTQVGAGSPPVGSAESSVRDARQRELAEALTGLDGVDQVMWRGHDGAIHVLRAGSQEARILMRGSGRTRSHAYLVDSPDHPDPFGYLAHPQTRALACTGAARDRCFHRTIDWLDASADTDYPGAVALLGPAFMPVRFSGDLMVAARRGFTFLRGQQGDHGNLDRAAMLTPLVFNGPDTNACDESLARHVETHFPRLVDIYPSVAVMLGAARNDPVLAELDGRVLDCIAPLAATNFPAL